MFDLDMNSVTKTTMPVQFDFFNGASNYLLGLCESKFLLFCFLTSCVFCFGELLNTISFKSSLGRLGGCRDWS